MGRTSKEDGRSKVINLAAVNALNAINATNHTSGAQSQRRVGM